MTIRLQIDSLNAEVNGKQVQLPVAPVLVNGSTLVPVRFIAESTGSEVNWDERNRIVVIRAKHTFASTDGKAQLAAYGLWKDVLAKTPCRTRSSPFVRSTIDTSRSAFMRRAAFYEVSCGAIVEHAKDAQEEDFNGMLKSLTLN